MNRLFEQGCSVDGTAVVGNNPINKFVNHLLNGLGHNHKGEQKREQNTMEKVFDNKPSIPTPNDIITFSKNGWVIPVKDYFKSRNVIDFKILDQALETVYQRIDALPIEKRNYSYPLYHNYVLIMEELIRHGASFEKYFEKECVNENGKPVCYGYLRDHLFNSGSVILFEHFVKITEKYDDIDYAFAYLATRAAKKNNFKLMRFCLEQYIRDYRWIDNKQNVLDFCLLYAIDFKNDLLFNYHYDHENTVRYLNELGAKYKNFDSKL